MKLISLEEFKSFCDEYDARWGSYPESKYEGEAIYEELKNELNGAENYRGMVGDRIEGLICRLLGKLENKVNENTEDLIKEAIELGISYKKEN